MKLLKASVVNFGSYQDLQFNFDNQGLALIYGSTGSGKSTLQDIPMWILFGQTAKQGNVDDVRSWTSQHSATRGILDLILNNGTQITVVRSRGKSSENDLFWSVDGKDYRGKDITETQKLLNDLLGVDPETYTIGGYYNEFSPTGTFFTAKASDRRALFENLANLSLPALLSDRIADAKKESRKAFVETLEKYNKTDGRYEQLTRTQAASKRDAERWDESQKRTIEELKIKAEKFSEEKETKLQVAQLKAETFENNRSSNIKKYKLTLERKIQKFAEDKVCAKCGEVKSKDAKDLLDINQEYEEMIKEETSALNPYILEQETIKTQQNPYFDRLGVEKYKTNPFLPQLEKLSADLLVTYEEKKDLKLKLNSIKHRQDSLNQLSKIIEDLRGALLKRSVKHIESEVNRYLETYFDSEIRVQFDLDDGDKLETLIWKSGHECSYRQLSKGQRGLLKLTFSLSAMKAVADKCAIHFNTLMFDEALDGLDSNLKLNAFNLFNELAKDHSSVFVIDHSESLRILFDKCYHVIIESDVSNIQEE